MSLGMLHWPPVKGLWPSIVANSGLLVHPGSAEHLSLCPLEREALVDGVQYVVSIDRTPNRPDHQA